ncbi:BON domain-containing protein [Peptococcaceae bacterium 1198_IL3148]
MQKSKDDELKRLVNAYLEADAEMRAYDIKADVVDGEVQLTGIVDTVSDKNRANEVVSRVNGIKRIENGIAISTDGQITDRGVAFEVMEELNADPRVNLKHIGVKSVGGKVFLMGHCTNAMEEQAAMEAALKARGVTEVISQIHHEAKEPSLEQLFHSQVNNDREAGRQMGIYTDI